MAEHDRWEDEREARRQAPPEHRDEGPYYRERGFSRPPRIGPTGMVSQSWTGETGTSGRYYEDVGQRAAYGGFAGGEAGYGSSRIREAGPPQDQAPYSERGARPGPYEARPIGYAPAVGGQAAFNRPDLIEQERRIGGPYTDYGRAFGGYGAGGGYTPEPLEGVGREQRSWNEAASRAAQGPHRGRGPKGYKRSDERIREDVSDRLTDDPIVDASDIEVTVSGGEVTLDGTVDSRTAKRRAEDCADSVMGVGHTQNNLRVRTRPAPGSVGAETDPRIAAVSEGHDADRASEALSRRE